MRISPEVEVAFSLAAREASRRRHEYISVEHLLYALLFDDETKKVLGHSGGDTEAMKKKIDRHLNDDIEAMASDTQPVPSLGFQRVVQRAAMHVQSSGKEELKGKNLIVQAINSNGQPLTLPLPLEETGGSFAKAYDGPPTDPKVFEENQKKLQEELQKRAEEARKKLEATQQPNAGAAAPAK